MTRIIPDFSKDKKFNELSFLAEIVFRRLWNKADDFGRYYADECILKAELFPRKEIRTPDLCRALLECERAALLVQYTIDGEKYLQINNFNQRVRTSKSRHPAPPSTNDGQMSDKCQTNVGQMSDKCRREEEDEYEEETNKEKVKKESAEEIYAAYPRKVAKPNAIKAILKALCKIAPDELLAKTKAYAQTVAEWSDEYKDYIPHPATWFNQERYNDNPETWKRHENGNRNYIGHTRKDTSNNQGSCNNSADYSRAYLEEY